MLPPQEPGGDSDLEWSVTECDESVSHDDQIPASRFLLNSYASVLNFATARTIDRRVALLISI